MIKVKREIPIFGGLDLVSGRSERIEKIRNMISENGINRKRNGFKLIAKAKDAINGIYKLGDELIIHSGNSLYRLDENSGGLEIIDTGSLVLENKLSEGTVMGNMLVIVGAGDGIVYTGSEVLALKDVLEPYVPTTSVRGYNEYEGFKRTKYEEPNLITRKRINTFVGTHAPGNRPCETRYKLDARVRTGGEFRVEVKMRLKRFIDNLNDTTTNFIGIDKNGDEINTFAIARFYRGSYAPGMMLAMQYNLCDLNGDPVRIMDDKDKIYEQEEIPFFAGTIGEDELKLTFNPIATELGQPNITVWYEAEDEETLELSELKHFKIGTAELGERLILMSRGDNCLYYTGRSEYGTYIPATNKVVLGSGAGIKAICQMADNTVGVFKEDSYFRVELYSDYVTRTERRELFHNVFYSSDSVGCISQKSVACVEYDILSLSDKGVYGATGENDASCGFKYMKKRSTSVENELLSYPKAVLEKACSTEHEGRYYLFVGDKAYIADSRHKRYTGKGEDLSFEYEWWIWDGCGARVAISLGDTLMIGRDDGKILSLWDGFYDLECHIFTENEGTLFITRTENKTIITLPADSPCRDGDTVYLENHLSRLGGNTSYVKDGDYFVYGDEGIKIYDGMDVRIFAPDGKLIAADKIKDYDPETGFFKCPRVENATEGGGYLVYHDRDASYKYTLKKEGGDFYLSDGENALVIHKDDLIILHYDIKKHIECELITHPVSLNGIESCTLYELGTELFSNEDSEVILGWETERAKREITVKRRKQLEIDNFDFDSVSFSAPFEKIYRRKILERGIGAVSFTVKSRDEKELAPQRLYCVYSARKGGNR